MREMKDSGIEWIGEIPSSWKVSKVKYSYDVVLGKMLQPNQKKDTEELVPYMCAANITWSGVDLSTEKQMWFSESEKSSYLLKNGDLLVTEGGDVAVSCIWNNELPLCCIQNAVHRVRPKNDASNRYLYYWLYMLKSQGYIDLVCNKATLAHFTKEKLDRCFLVLPPSYEQKRIASYLDARCDEIDALIAAKEKTNALLRERRQSIIYEAVTKGLDPNAPMKDSGVEWIGEISEGWKTVRIKHVIDRSEYGIKIGPFGSTLANRTLISGPYNVYSQANLISNSFSDTNHHIDGNTFDDLRGYEVKPGDVCVSMMGTIGKCRVVPAGITKGIMDSHLIKIRLDEEQIDPRFFEYVYDKDNSGVCYTQMQYEKKGTIMDGLNTAIVKNLVIPLPPLTDQVVISNYLDTKCAESDALICKNGQEIRKLKEYRQSLIYEAVTGKIEV